MAHGVRVPPAEFPVVVDRESYFIPTVGIAFVSGIAGGIMAMIVGMAAAGRGLQAPDDTAFFTWLAATFVGGAVWWVRRRRRIHRERKLIVDDAGITYVAFANAAQLIRWRDILDITEEEEWELGRWLTVRHRSGRLVIEAHAFHGYDEIRNLARTYLPDRTVLCRS